MVIIITMSITIITHHNDHTNDNEHINADAPVQSEALQSCTRTSSDLLLPLLKTNNHLETSLVLTCYYH